MELPGMSIFKGSESIKLNSSNENLEEEQDEIEDEARRQIELHNQLQNAFDDLCDGNEETVEGSHNFNNSYGNDDNNRTNYLHYNGQNMNSYPRANNHIGAGDAISDQTQCLSLKHKLESRTREYKHATELLISERKQSELQIDELKKRLALSEAERERANMNRTQTHELLVESKAKISNLDDAMEKMKVKNKSLENKNSELIRELESTKTMFSDLQHKYNLIESNLGFKNERTVDSILKATNERHRGELHVLQQQVECFRDKYEESLKEYKNLDIRYNELQKSREILLIEKSDVINQLAKSLEESQRRTQHLMEKPDLTQENLRLQRMVSSLERDADDMRKKISNLTSKLEKTSAELDLMSTVLNDNDVSQSGRRLSISNNSNKLLGSTPLPPEDRISKLNAELQRCLSSQKEKREEIKKLNENLKQKDEELNRIRSEENKILIELNIYKEKSITLENKLKLVETELQRNNESLEENNKMKYELERTKFLLNDYKSEQERLKTLNNNLSTELNVTKEKIINLEKKLKEINESKSNLNSCVKCIDKVTEITKYEIQNLQLKNSCSNNLKEINDLKVEVDKLNKIINDLKQKIQLTSERDQLIESLKEKAQQFEELIKSRDSNSKDVLTSPIKVAVSDRSVSTTPDLENTSIREIEKQVRAELSKSFANRIKQVEDKFHREIQKHENIIETMHLELKKNIEEYNNKVNEVDILRQVVLVERSRMQGMLSKQNEESKALLEKNNEVVKKCYAELENAQLKVQRLTKEIHEKQEQIDSERKSMAAVMSQWNTESIALKQQIEELKNKLKDLNEEKVITIKHAEDKYKSAKQTALNYKSFADNQEKHYINEVKRIKEGYTEALEKVKLRMDEAYKNQQKKFDERIENLKKDYQNKTKLNQF